MFEVITQSQEKFRGTYLENYVVCIQLGPRGFPDLFPSVQKKTSHVLKYVIQICGDSICKGTSGSVNKYLQNNYKLLIFLCTNINFYHPSPQYPIPFAYAHLPHHGGQFCTKERRIGFGPLGVIITLTL